MIESVRAWRIKDRVVHEYYGAPYKRIRTLTDLEIDYLNENYHALVNQHDKPTFYRDVLTAIRQLEMNNMDWWYEKGVFFFTHECHRTVIYLAIR